MNFLVIDGNNRRMRSVKMALCLTVVACGAVYAQQTNQKFYLPQAVIQRNGSSVTLTANDPRPLLQAIKALREEYEWAVNYEEPPYKSNYDLVEVGAPTWRATHPGVDPKIPNGGFFQSEYTEVHDISAATDAEEQQVLSKIVSDYNQSTNPGHFTVLKQSDGSYAVVGDAIRDNNGVPRPVTPLLDTPISISGTTPGGFPTLNLIMQALSTASGFKFGPGTLSIPLRNGGNSLGLFSGGDNLPARSFLVQMLRAMGNGMNNAIGMKNTFVWDLNFDPVRPQYVLNVTSVRNKHVRPCALVLRSGGCARYL